MGWWEKMMDRQAPNSFASKIFGQDGSQGAGQATPLSGGNPMAPSFNTDFANTATLGTQPAPEIPTTPDYDALQTYDPPEYLAEWGKGLGEFYSGRMDDSFSVFGPSARDAMSRRIAGNLSVSQRDIEDTMRSKGLFGSGVSASLKQNADTIAAMTRADVDARISLEDESARERAAVGLGNLRQDIMGWEVPREFAISGLPTSESSAVGDQVRLGPEQGAIDIWSVDNAAQTQKFLDEQMEQFKNNSNWSPDDFLQAIFKSFGSNADPAQYLLAFLPMLTQNQGGG